MVLTDDDLDRLLDDLASPDPAVRDDGAFTQVATAVGEGRLTPGQLERLGDVATERLGHPQVQARTFAPLVLAVLAGAGVTRPAWTQAVVRWYPREDDLRGHDPRLGWLHAAAHGADALAELGRAGAEEPVVLLDALARRLVAPTETVFRDQEDDRIAHALALVLTDPGVTQDEAVGWLDPVTALFATGEPGPVPAHVSNTLRTLRSLSIALEHDVLADGEPVVVPHAAAVRAAVAEALRPPTAWMWS